MKKRDRKRERALRGLLALGADKKQTKRKYE